MRSEMQSLFITGTGTGVGKTVLMAALLAAAREAGLDVAPMKPIQTGCTRMDDRLRAPDLDFCLAAAGLAPEPPMYDTMVPYAFEPACSPHLAAREAGVSISITTIRNAFDLLQSHHTAVLTEGAGGVMAPIDEQRTMLDLMRALALPVIVAASPRLGTLNHTLLTLQALRSAELQVAGVVLVETEPAPWGLVERDNAVTIETMGRTRVLGTLRYTKAFESANTARAKLIRAGSKVIEQTFM